MTAYADRRAAGGEHMPGVFEVSRSVPVAAVIEDILLLSECSNEGEREGQVRYLPSAEASGHVPLAAAVEVVEHEKRPRSRRPRQNTEEAARPKFRPLQ